MIGVIAGTVAVTTGSDVLDVARQITGTATPEPSPEPPRAPEPAALDAEVTQAVSGTAADTLSIVATAQTVVLAEPDTAVPAAHLAYRLRVPLMLTSASVSGSSEAPSSSASESASEAAADDVPAALEQLEVRRAVAVGSDAVAQVAREGGVDDVVQLTPSAQYEGRAARVLIRAVDLDEEPDLPDPGFDQQAVEELVADAPPAASATDTVVLVRPRDRDALPTALAARAVGHTVMRTRADDLRADPDLIDRFAELGDPEQPPSIVLGGPGMDDVDPELIAAFAPTATTGEQLPGGGQLVIDPQRPRARRYISLYGSPGSGALGVFGEQPVDATVTRAEDIARQYRDVTDDDVTIIPAFEIIATVASASAGDDGDYSAEIPVKELEPAVEAAREADMYVLLDLQPGRTDFVTQAKRYRKLLRQPHVGLALDPEWRLKPDEVHLRQIGSVGIDEVNRVGDWLADLVEKRNLPQKMLLLHQFRISMIRNREGLDTSREELAFAIQMDGQGPQGTKLETWSAITADAPPRVEFGWKNFYDEDSPVRTPADTMAVTPSPVFVSYQ